MDGEGPAVAFFLQPERVIVVLRVGGVDGDDEWDAPVLAAGDFRGIGLFRHGAGFGEHVFRKRGAQAETVDHGDDIDAGIAGPAEHFDDTATWRDVGIVPICQIDHHPLSGLGGGVADEVDGAIDGLVIALDPVEAAASAQHADEAPGAAGEDFFDLAADLWRRIGHEFAAGAASALGLGLLDGNEHPVAIQGGAGVTAGNMDAGKRREVQAGGEVGLIGHVREEEGVALRVEFQVAGERIAALGAQA